MSSNTTFEKGNMGIYCYKDTFNNGEIVYIGKDSNIHLNKRHYAHHSPCMYSEQKINRILQSNPNRYEYCVLKSWKGDKNNFNFINAMEMLYIRRYHPKFNFTIGGDGFKKGHVPWNKGVPHSDEIRKKLSENHANVKKENNPNWKSYARLKKAGKATDKNKTQRYGIVKDGKMIKRSVNIDFLLSWFDENYPNEELVNEGGI